MRRIVLCMLAAGFCIISSATDYHQAVRNRLNAIFRDLDKSKVPTGFLYDYAIEDIDLTYFDGGELHDSNYVFTSEFAMIIQTLGSAVVNSNAGFQTDSVLVELHAATEAVTESYVPINCIAYDYNFIREDAISNGYLTYTSGSVHDVYRNGVWQDPYNSKAVFAFAPATDVIEARTGFYFDLQNFFKTNLDIETIEFDCGDGQGYQVCPATGLVYCSMSGDSNRELKMRLTLESGAHLEAHSEILINRAASHLPDAGIISPDDILQFSCGNNYDGGTVCAKVSIKYANGACLSRPFIIVEGFDPYVLEHAFDNTITDEDGSTNFNTIMNDLDEDIIRSYDIIYVDVLSYKADLRANADLIKLIIDRINAIKPSTASDNIIMGQSMGGLIVRYALCTMENSHHPHHCFMYISDDAPHLGANIPLGALYAVNDIIYSLGMLDSNVAQLIASGLKFEDFEGAVDEIKAVLNAKSVKQMLVNYVNSSMQIDNSVHSTWQNELSDLGFPRGDEGVSITNIAISNGGAITHQNNIAKIDANISLSAVVDFILQCIRSHHKENCPINSRRFHPSSLGVFADIYPNIDRNTLVYHFYVNYKKYFRWGQDVVMSLYNSYKYSPSNIIPLDEVNGSYFQVDTNIRDIDDEEEYFGLISIDSLLINQSIKFMFIPTASSLCLGNGSTIPESYYGINNINIGSYYSDIPFDRVFLNSSDRSMFHTSLRGYGLESFLESVLLSEDANIIGPFFAENLSQYTTLNMTNVSWSTSDTSVATITSSGTLQIISPGFVDVIANGLVAGLPRTISMRVMTGIPNYDLTYLDRSVFYTNYSVYATPTNQEINDYLPILNLRYDWGIKIGEGDITWSVNGGLVHNVAFLNEFDRETVYFKASNSIYSSAISSIVLRPRPLIHEFELPINGDGEILGPNGEIIETRSINSQTLARNIKCVVNGNVTLYFDYIPNSFDICRAAIQNDDIRNIIMTMKPWGEDEFTVISVLVSDEETGETQESALRFIYNDDL